VVELLGSAGRPLGAAADLDAQLAPLHERLQALLFEAQDLGGELRAYLESIEAPPGRLEAVEERLAVFARLERKHGGTTADVLAHAERCRARRGELEGAEVALSALETELAEAAKGLDAVAAELSAARHGAAPELAAAVRERCSSPALSVAVPFDCVAQRSSPIVRTSVSSDTGPPRSETTRTTTLLRTRSARYGRSTITCPVPIPAGAIAYVSLKVPRGAGLKAMRAAVGSMMARPGASDAPPGVAPPQDAQDVEHDAETTDRSAP